MTALVLAILVSAGSAPGGFQIDAGGFGPLRSDRWPADAALRKAFVGAALKHGDDTSEGEKTGEHVQVEWRGDTLVLHRDGESKRLFSAEGMGRDITGPAQVRVGDRFEKLVRAGPYVCTRGSEEEADRVTCSLRSVPNVFFVGYPGDLPEWKGSDADVPAEALLEKLAIKAIVWKPKAR